MQAQLQREIQEIEKEENSKLQEQIEQMRREVLAETNSLNIDQELMDYKRELED